MEQQDGPPQIQLMRRWPNSVLRQCRRFVDDFGAEHGVAASSAAVVVQIWTVAVVTDLSLTRQKNNHSYVLGERVDDLGRLTRARGKRAGKRQ